MKPENNRIKVCLILPCALPVPAVHGGAVELLAHSISKYNEKFNLLDLCIVSIHDDKAVKESEAYKNTSWIFIKKNLFDVISDYLFRILRRLFRRSFLISTYDYKVLKRLKAMEFDRIIFEGGNILFMTKYQKYFPKKKLMFHLHYVERPDYDINRCAGSVITISEYVKRVLLENSKLEPENVYTLLNGIEIEKFAVSPSEEVCYSLKKRLGIRKGDFVLLFVGRIIEEKGVKELISSVLALDDPSVKLILAGQGASFHKGYRREIEMLSKNATEQIKLVGYIPNEQLYCYFGIADCFIMPSIWEEGAGLVQSEAYAAGKPAIVSNRGGIPEYRLEDASRMVEYDPDFVKNLKAAIVEMRKLVFDKKIDVQRMREEVEKYSAERYYLNYVEVLRQEVLREG